MQIDDGAVSVVIPCFNSGAFLRRAIDSILSQSKPPSEVIVVNDGSTDEKTLEVLQQLRNTKSITIIDHEINQGLPASRNSGAQNASGRLILFLDADDWYDRFALEIMLSQVPEDESKFFMYCDIFLAGKRSGMLGKDYLPFSQLIINGLPCSILVPRDEFIGEGPYREDLTLGMEDWHLNLALISRGYMPMHIDSPLFYYYVSDSGMYLSKTLKSYFTVWREIRNSYPHLYSISHLWQSFILQVRERGFLSVVPALVVLSISVIPNDKLATFLLLCLRSTSIHLKKVHFLFPRVPK
jgi:glycosyltransferase involved in cell wall biosynthesis